MLLLPVISEEGPHGGGPDDGPASLSIIMAAGLFPIDCHVQSRLFLPFNRSNFLLSSLFMYKKFVAV